MGKQLNEGLVDRQIRSIQFVADYTGVRKVKIGFVDVVDVEPAESENESKVCDNQYAVTSNHMPHDSFVKAMNELKEHAFAISEMNVVKSEFKDYGLVGIQLSGDLFLNKSRVQFVVVKRVGRTEKLMKIGPTPQITLSDGSKYVNWKDLQKKVELAVSKAWDYLKGEHQNDDIQLAFSFEGVSATPKAPKVQAEKKEVKQKREKKPEKAPKEVVMSAADIASSSAIVGQA